MLDRLVANAGIGPDRSGNFPSVELATDTININLFSTINFVKEFLPILSNNGRVVIVSSVLGNLATLSQPLRTKLLDPNITESDILRMGH